MNTLKIVRKTKCFTCQCERILRKSFQVRAMTQEAAREEVKDKIEKWEKATRHSNCRVCASIIREVAADLRNNPQRILKFALSSKVTQD